MGDNFQQKDSVLYRISQIAKNEGISITALESRIGASKGVLSRALKQDSDIQSKWIQKIIAEFPRYSSKWLIMGVEPIYSNPDYEREKIADYISNSIFTDFSNAANNSNPSLTALIKIGDKFYSANRLSELEDVVKEIKSKL